MPAESRIAFYMDEHVRAAVSESLRRRGVDVLTAQQADLRRASDEAHLRWAVREGRTILIQDADFLRVHASNQSNPGIVSARQGTSPGAIVRSLMLVYNVLRAPDMIALWNSSKPPEGGTR